ncbi:MAG: HlyC/CorC family transporter [Alphaproteobacteria bacterium]
MESLLIFTIAIIVLVIISGFFAAAETAITGASQATIHKLKSEGNRKARIVSLLRKDKERLISTVLLANSACNSAISALGAMMAIKLFSTNEFVAYATIVTTIIIFVFAEVLPKAYAFENAERMSLKIAPCLNIIVKTLYPITTAVQIAVNFILGFLRLKGKVNSIISATEELRGAIEMHHKKGLVVKSDRDMLGSILDLADTEVKEIMVHRKNMITIDIDLPVKQIMKEALESSHTRVPLWKDNPDNIIGILNIKDLLSEVSKHEGDLNKIKVEAIISNPWYVPDNTMLKEQLHEFRIKKIHFALVVDEYGDLKGLVTLEDILEEIVGQIEDEHDEEIEGIKLQFDGSYIISGNVTIRDINRQLDWNLPAEEFSTLAGLIMHETEKIPGIGENFNLYGLNLEIEEKENNHIAWIKAKKI